MSKTSEQYAQGYAAYPDGANPYEDGTQQNLDWQEGFKDAAEDGDDEADEDIEEDFDDSEVLDDEILDDEEDADEDE